MKQLLFLALTFAACLFAGALGAQVVDSTGISDVSFSDITVEDAIKWANALYMALVIVWGYFARAFKFKVKPGNFVFVVIAGGVVIGGTFIAMGWAKAVPIALSLLASLGVFDAILRPGQNAIKAALADKA